MRSNARAENTATSGKVLKVETKYAAGAPRMSATAVHTIASIIGGRNSGTTPSGRSTAASGRSVRAVRKPKGTPTSSASAATPSP